MLVFRQESTAMRKFLPMIIVNCLVFLAVVAIIVTKPNYTRATALAMPLLLVANLWMMRSAQRK